MLNENRLIFLDMKMNANIKEVYYVIGMLIGFASCCRLPLVECFPEPINYVTKDYQTRWANMLETDSIQITVSATTFKARTSAFEDPMKIPVLFRLRIKGVSVGKLKLSQKEISSSILSGTNSVKGTIEGIDKFEEADSKKRGYDYLIQFLFDFNNQSSKEIKNEYLIVFRIGSITVGERKFYLQDSIFENSSTKL